MHTHPLTNYHISLHLRMKTLKVLKPFWTPAYKELSEKLLLPTVIDCVDSDTNYYNSLSNGKLGNFLEGIFGFH
jgi:cytoplasmic iron level regulating protein YaaA (DUF328/UPF0246 family)